MIQSDLCVTILINNYNYGRFLGHAIDSALNQTYQNVEVIVVDDGSTDESRDVIRSYGKRIIPILKDNGGQASAFNAGFAASQGEIICMLDSDDLFHNCKVERVVPYAQPNSLIYHRLQLQPGLDIIPQKVIPSMNFYRHAQRYRFFPYAASPTSGLVIRRDLALRLMPLPTQYVRSSADDFIVRGACLLGRVIGIPDVLGTYRNHGENLWYGKQLPKSAGFMDELENYLNRKLIEVGKTPVIDFYHSIYGREYIAQSAPELTRLALSVFKNSPDFLTLKFLLTTLWRAARRTRSPRGLDGPMGSRPKVLSEKR
jgi:glycosyltransferase involved in cell wall biosynthesis